MYVWNTTIDDTSPFLTFSPYSDGAASGGWAPKFQDLGFFNGQVDEDSEGMNSVHTTRFQEATVYLQFEGTAIYVYGSPTCAYKVVLDNNVVEKPLSTPQDMLYYKEDLLPDAHFIAITAYPEANSTQQLSFDKLVFTEIGTNSSVNGLTQVHVDNQNNTALHYSGNWSTVNVNNVPSSAAPAPYMETSDPKATVSLNFTGGVAVSINSMRDENHWTYNVSLNGIMSSYNSSTWWLMGDTVLFYQTNLDPTREHSISLINTGETSHKMSLNYFTVFMPNGTITDGNGGSTGSQSKKIGVGAIVGSIVGAVGLLALAIVSFSWWRKRRPATTDTPFEPQEPVAPFPRNGRPHLWYKGVGNSTPEMSAATALETIAPSLPYREESAGNPVGPPTRSVAPPVAPEPPMSPDFASAGPVNMQTRPSRYPYIVDPSSSATPRQTVDINQIIELIAQRIDPAPRRPTEMPEGTELPPPQYPA